MIVCSSFLDCYFLQVLFYRNFWHLFLSLAVIRNHFWMYPCQLQGCHYHPLGLNYRYFIFFVVLPPGCGQETLIWSLGRWNKFVDLNRFFDSSSLSCMATIDFHIFNRCLKTAYLVYFGQEQVMRSLIRTSWKKSNAFNYQFQCYCSVVCPKLRGIYPHSAFDYF